jgi:hypothetical protein
MCNSYSAVRSACTEVAWSSDFTYRASSAGRAALPRSRTYRIKDAKCGDYTCCASRTNRKGVSPLLQLLRRRDRHAYNGTTIV